MRIHFDNDNDPEDRWRHLHYGVLVCLGLALAGVTGWLVYLERLEPVFLWNP